MTEGKELHYGKLTLLIGSIICLIVVAVLVLVGIYVCFTFGGWYLFLSALIFIVAIVLGVYGVSMLTGFLMFNKTQKILEEKNYCFKCSRPIGDNIICPYCGKKVNKWYLKMKENQKVNENGSKE